MKNMMLASAQWSADIKTFKLIPITADCPFIEAIFAVEHKSLALINKYTKQQFKFIPQVDPNGDVVPVKQGKRPTGNPYKEQRVQIEVNFEHYIIERDEQEAFIKMFAINADTFDYKQYLDAVTPSEQTEVDSKQDAAVISLVPTT